jgi:hypothetical protein
VGASLQSPARRSGRANNLKRPYMLLERQKESAPAPGQGWGRSTMCREGGADTLLILVGGPPISHYIMV